MGSCYRIGSYLEVLIRFEFFPAFPVVLEPSIFRKIRVLLMGIYRYISVVGDQNECISKNVEDAKSSENQ